MKKRLIIIALFLCLVFAGCNGGGNAGDTTPTATPTTKPDDTHNQQTQESYAFVYNNVKVVPDQLVDSIVTALGSDYTYYESPSCAYVGMDKCYVYSSFSIYTYPDEKSIDHILTIELTDDMVKTAEGIMIGDTAEKVKSVYGDKYTEAEGSLAYEQGKTKLCFIIKNNSVISIQYNLIEK